MKKAKIILTAIAVFAVVGGALAFKTAKFNAFQLWTISGTTSVSATTAIGGPIYTTTVPYCKTVPLFATTLGAVVLDVFESAPAFVLAATAPGGPQTLITYTACATFQTFTRLAQ